MVRIPGYDDDFSRFQKFSIRRTSNEEFGETRFSKKRHAYGPNETRNRDLAASNFDERKVSSKLKEELAEIRTFKELENAFNTFKIRNQVTSQKLNTISLNIFLDKIKTLVDPENWSEQINRNQKFIREIFGELLKNLKRSNRYGSQETPWTLSMIFSSLGLLHDRLLKNEMLEALALQIESEDTFTAQQIEMCFDGLSNQEDPNTCKKVISELGKKLECCQESFSIQQIATCFYGLADQDTETCRPIITELEKKLAESKESFTARQIAMCFYGLNNQDPAVCKGLINILEEKLDTCAESFDAQQVAMCFQGAKYHIENFSNLEKFIDRLKTSLEKISLSPSDFDICLRYLSLFNYQYSKIMGKNLTAFSELKQNLLNARPQDQSRYSSTKEEERVFDIVRKQYPDFKLDKFKVIDGIQLDLYLPAWKINIEVDGQHHHWRKDDKLRDEYLEKIHHIKTLRVQNHTHEADILNSLNSVMTGK